MPLPNVIAPMRRNWLFGGIFIALAVFLAGYAR
jgi:hypothetical protein